MHACENNDPVMCKLIQSIESDARVADIAKVVSSKTTWHEASTLPSAIESGEVKTGDIILKVDGKVDTSCHAVFELPILDERGDA